MNLFLYLVSIAQLVECWAIREVIGVDNRIITVSDQDWWRDNPRLQSSIDEENAAKLRHLECMRNDPTQLGSDGVKKALQYARLGM